MKNHRFDQNLHFFEQTTMFVRLDQLILLFPLSRIQNISQNTDKLKAGFHMIADDRGSQIADRRKFCDRLRSYGNTLLRSPAILRS